MTELTAAEQQELLARLRVAQSTPAPSADVPATPAPAPTSGSVPTPPPPAPIYTPNAYVYVNVDGVFFVDSQGHLLASVPAQFVTFPHPSGGAGGP